MTLDTRPVEEIIHDIAHKHFIGKLSKIELDDGDRKRLVDYSNSNRRHVEDILYKIGYSFRTCTNYSPVAEVMSIIKGQPYIEYVANEINDDMLINVEYYDNLLSARNFTFKQFIAGKYYEATFDANTHEFKLVNGEMIIKQQQGHVSKRGVTTLKYQAFDLE